MASKTAPWRNRITGHGEEDPEQLLANPLNWRKHPGKQRDAMRGTLTEVGWVQTVIVNTVTGNMVDGHLRVEEAISKHESMVPVTYVELSPEEEAVVLATLDPIGAMATKDDENLAALLKDVEVEDRALADLLARQAKDPRDAYTRKVATPRYEPTQDKAPPVSDLYDEVKTKTLVADILQADDMDEDTRRFLLAAATRHTVFDYGAIAEFYAHADAPIQRLMEKSALVILDFEDAIRDGYVRFTETMKSLSEDEDDAEA